jgi:hypothetical protein
MLQFNIISEFNLFLNSSRLFWFATFFLKFFLNLPYFQWFIYHLYRNTRLLSCILVSQSLVKRLIIYVSLRLASVWSWRRARGPADQRPCSGAAHFNDYRREKSNWCDTTPYSGLGHPYQVQGLPALLAWTLIHGCESAQEEGAQGKIERKKLD